jgi:hypothetical protein
VEATDVKPEMRLEPRPPYMDSSSSGLGWKDRAWSDFHETAEEIGDRSLTSLSASIGAFCVFSDAVSIADIIASSGHCCWDGVFREELVRSLVVERSFFNEVVDDEWPDRWSYNEQGTLLLKQSFSYITAINIQMLLLSSMSLSYVSLATALGCNNSNTQEININVVWLMMNRR